MSSDRRTFLKQLLMASVASQLIDIDELLWTPKSMITVPTLPTQFVVLQTGAFDARNVITAYNTCIAEALLPFSHIPPGTFMKTTRNGRVTPITSKTDVIVGMCMGPVPALRDGYTELTARITPETDD